MTILASVNNKTVMPGITPIADVPDRPTIGTATATGASTATVTFTTAATGGTPTTFTATSNPGSITGTASSSPVTVSGLSAETSYTFTVTAGNSTGTSPASSASNSITTLSAISGGYDSLATVIVPSGGLSSITFGGIPAGYKHLQIRYIRRNTAVTDAQYMRVNGDDVQRYSFHMLRGDGSSATSIAGTTQSVIELPYVAYSGTTANAFGVGVLDLVDYSNTSKFKTFRVLGGADLNGSGAINYVSGLYQSLDAISSILIYSAPGNIAEFSQFALYGVK